MVYNCAYMPAICANIVKHLGSLPTAGSESVYHTDRNPSRKKVRRNPACPGNWNKLRIPDGSWRCPETDQPAWRGYDENGRVRGPFKPMLSQKLNANGETSHNRLAS